MLAFLRFLDLARDDAGFNCFNAFNPTVRSPRGLDLVTPGQVDTHALADEEGRQRHVDVPRAVVVSCAASDHDMFTMDEKDKTHDMTS